MNRSATRKAAAVDVEALSKTSGDVGAVKDVRVLRLVALEERRGDLVSTFSGGMARRLEITRGMLHTPTVLFLDEPTVGLDPQTRALMWDDVLRMRDEEGVTIFLTTHYMAKPNTQIGSPSSTTAPSSPWAPRRPETPGRGGHGRTAHRR